MKILWMINEEPVQVKQSRGEVQKGTGGWLETVSKMVGKDQLLQVIYPGRREIKHVIDGVEYIQIDRISEGNLKEGIKKLSDIILEFNPDIIHIWGTEMIHSYAMIEAADKNGMLSHTVVSIQGLASICSKHYYGGLSEAVIKSRSFRDVIKGDGLKQQQVRMKNAGEYEKKTIEKTKHVIGRTTWDYICSKCYNPKVIYHINEESLRPEFYKENWDIENIKNHRLFIAQAHYPLKGFHFLLEAVAILKATYFDISLHVGGYDNAFNSGLRETGYGRYIKKLIKKYGLSNCVTYVGLLSAKEMIQEYLQSEIYVSASAIENSSNSIAEAMLLGMPVVASNVGGTPDMLVDQEEGLLYQWDSPEMLAYSLKKLFDSKELELSLASRAKERAMSRQDFQANYDTLKDIYKQIV